MNVRKRTPVPNTRDVHDGVRLQKSPTARHRRAKLIAAMRGKWRSKLTTDEVMRLSRRER